jgi:HNH endonuclease
MDNVFRYQVQKRAEGRCEYCGLPEEHTDAPFQLDHIIAEKHGGPSTMENCAWSCMYCNSYKGPNLAGWHAESQSVIRLYHPRNDTWVDHFTWDGPVLQGLTPIGVVTIEVLRINLEDAVLFRKLLLELGIPLK